MTSIFMGLNELCGFTDGVRVNEQTGSVSNYTNTMRLCMADTIRKISLANLEPNSSVAFKVNGHTHTSSVADARGNCVMQLDGAADLSRIHCPQVCFKGGVEANVSYAIE